jgi:hypothetical protein
VDPTRDVVLLMRRHAGSVPATGLTCSVHQARLDRQSPNLGAAGKVDKVKPPVLSLPHLVGFVERNVLEWLLRHGMALLASAPSISPSSRHRNRRWCEQLGDVINAAAA